MHTSRHLTKAERTRATPAKKVRHEAFVQALADLKIGEGPNVPTQHLIELIDATKARIARKDGPVNNTEVTNATKIGDIDWLTDLNQGPNGILTVALSMNLRTVGDLIVLEDRPIQRTKFKRQIGDRAWAVVEDVARIAKNNAQAARNATDALTPVSADPTTCDHDWKIDGAHSGPEYCSKCFVTRPTGEAVNDADTGEDDPQDDISAYRYEPPSLHEDPDASNTVRKRIADMNVVLKGLRAGEAVLRLAHNVGLHANTIYSWKQNHPDYRELADLAVAAYQRYGAIEPSDAPGNILEDGSPEAQEAILGVEDAPTDFVAGEGDVTIPFDPEKHDMPSGRLVTKKTPDLTNDPDVPIQDRRHDLAGIKAPMTDVDQYGLKSRALESRGVTYSEPVVDDFPDPTVRDLDEILEQFDEECPVVLFVDQDGDLDAVDIHPRLGREIYRLWDSGVWGKDRAEVIVNLVSYAIRKLT